MTIGIRMELLHQDVPVAKATNMAVMKTMDGRRAADGPPDRKEMISTSHSASCILIVLQGFFPPR
jgi:hypothetical protein